MRTRPLFAAAAALLCAACASTQQNVRELASGDLRCNSSQVAVNQTQKGGYFGDDVYRAEGCGLEATYECERIHVLLIPAGTMGCKRTE